MHSVKLLRRHHNDYNEKSDLISAGEDSSNWNSHELKSEVEVGITILENSWQHLLKVTITKKQTELQTLDG